MDTKLILEFYGIACAVLLPLCLIMIIIFSRKGGFIDSLNKKLDKMTAKKDPKEEDKPKEEQAKKTLTPWEEHSKSLTCLKLKVGDTYMCVLNDIEKNLIGSRRDWTASDPFVGKVDEKTCVFKAEKVGGTLIICSDIRIYYIEVEARKRHWFATEIYDAFCNGLHKSELIKNCSKYKIKDEAETHQISIKGIPQTKNVIVEYDDEQHLTKCLFVMENNQSNIKSITDGLEERMEKIDSNPTDITFWIHKKRSDYEDSIDSACFIWSKEREILFGLANNWRQKGMIEEFCANTGMFINSFSSLLDTDELPRILASDEVKKEGPEQSDNNVDNPTQDDSVETEPATVESEKKFKDEDTNADADDFEIEEGMAVQFQNEEDENWEQNLSDDFLDDMANEDDRELNMN